MNLKNKRPVFVTLEFYDEIERLSKAALMDMVWDYAQQIAGTEGAAEIMDEFRKRREIVMNYRNAQ
jgi:hypothetical protein